MSGEAWWILVQPIWRRTGRPRLSQVCDPHPSENHLCCFYCVSLATAAAATAACNTVEAAAAAGTAVATSSIAEAVVTVVVSSTVADAAADGFFRRAFSVHCHPDYHWCCHLNSHHFIFPDYLGTFKPAANAWLSILSSCFFRSSAFTRALSSSSRESLTFRVEEIWTLAQQGRLKLGNRSRR